MAKKLLGWDRTIGSRTRGYTMADGPTTFYNIERSNVRGAVYFTVTRNGEHVGDRGTLGLAKEMAEQDAALLTRGRSEFRDAPQAPRYSGGPRNTNPQQNPRKPVRVVLQEPGTTNYGWMVWVGGREYARGLASEEAARSFAVTEITRRGLSRAVAENMVAKASIYHRNPAISDDKAIRAFLAKQVATSKYLVSNGDRITMKGLGSDSLAKWVDGKIKLGIAYGNVSQSYIKKIAKMAPAYLLTADSWWALPARMVKLLKKEGRE